MKYNLKEIMEYAWAWFKNDDIELDEIEYSNGESNKTFANCLKASWNRAKEMVEYEEDLAETVAKSEELKAFKWAEIKLGVEVLISDEKKFFDVQNYLKGVAYTCSVYQAAMRTVKLSIKLNVEEIKVAA